MDLPLDFATLRLIWWGLLGVLLIAFALTEPNSGSDPGSMRTTAVSQQTRPRNSNKFIAVLTRRNQLNDTAPLRPTLFLSPDQTVCLCLSLARVLRKRSKTATGRRRRSQPATVEKRYSFRTNRFSGSASHTDRVSVRLPGHDGDETHCGPLPVTVPPHST